MNNFNCRFDGSLISKIISFGKMPLGNGFLSKENIDNEYFYNLDVAVNNKIGLLQIMEQPNPSKMFHSDYAFFSRSSSYMKTHFKETADELLKILKGINSNLKDSLVVEIGSNDGIMLEHIVKKGIDALGIEPSKNVSDISNKFGIKTLNKFFNYETAKEACYEYGKSDIIFAANVFCHIPEIKDLANSCSYLLKENGILIFEDPYLGDVLSKTTFDQIYDEHVFLFSCMSVKKIFENYGLKLFDARKINTHGGSMRYYLSKNQNINTTERLKKLLDQEIDMGMLDIKTYINFASKCEIVKYKFRETLETFKNDGKKIVGYGATSKSTTILNYCDIGPELIDFIVDTTPEKQFKFSPGKHIPILPYENFIPYPDICVLFAWNHRKEILDKEIKFKGDWVTHIYEEIINI